MKQTKLAEKSPQSLCRDFYRNFCRNLVSNLFEFLKSSGALQISKSNPTSKIKFCSPTIF
eukprot:UN24354